MGIYFDDAWGSQVQFVPILAIKIAVKIMNTVKNILNKLSKFKTV
jgi:hypothetical protein